MKWDARSKILLVLAVAMTYGMRLPVLAMWYVVLGLSLLFFASGRIKMGWLSLACFGLWQGLPHLSFLPGWLDHLLMMQYYLWPSILAGHFLLLTTSSYELVHGLRKWHLPEYFLITLAVMYRFLPAIKQDARAILQALRVRGVLLSKRELLTKPYRAMTCFLLPLLFSLLRTAQDLTVASLTKGLAMDSRPCEYLVSRWTWLDWSLCLWSVSLLFLTILF